MLSWVKFSFGRTAAFVSRHPEVLALGLLLLAMALMLLGGASPGDLIAGNGTGGGSGTG